MTDWAAFHAETAQRIESLRTALQLWQLEVVATRCTWQLWPSEATRRCYVVALAERESCEASLLALQGSRPRPWCSGGESAQ